MKLPGFNIVNQNRLGSLAALERRLACLLQSDIREPEIPDELISHWCVEGDDPRWVAAVVKRSAYIGSLDVHWKHFNNVEFGESVLFSIEDLMHHCGNVYDIVISMEDVFGDRNRYDSFRAVVSNEYRVLLILRGNGSIARYGFTAYGDPHGWVESVHTEMENMRVVDALFKRLNGFTSIPENGIEKSIDALLASFTAISESIIRHRGANIDNRKYVAFETAVKNNVRDLKALKRWNEALCLLEKYDNAPVPSDINEKEELRSKISELRVTVNGLNVDGCMIIRPAIFETFMHELLRLEMGGRI